MKELLAATVMVVGAAVARGEVAPLACGARPSRTQTVVASTSDLLQSSSVLAALRVPAVAGGSALNRACYENSSGASCVNRRRPSPWRSGALSYPNRNPNMSDLRRILNDVAPTKTVNRWDAKDRARGA